jgi:hypothetical protein
MKRLLVFLFCALLGCGGSKAPPLSSDSKAMIRKFEEHLPNHKTQLFEGLCKEVDRLHNSNKISDEEFQSLHSVCGPASTGQWDRAKTNLEPLSKAMNEQK